MGKPSAPPQPDYQAAAQAQGQANNPNVTSPYGTQSYTPGTPAGFDGAAYLKANPDVQRDPHYATNPYQHYIDYGQKEGRQGVFNASAIAPTVTQTLSPGQQAIFDKNQQNQLGLASLGSQGINAAKGIIGAPVDYSSMPQTGNYDDTRKKVMDAMMGRANEDYGKQTDQSNSDLVAAGIRPGSKAYADKQQMIERSHNDARQQAEIAGGNAASQAFGMDNARRQQAITEMLSQRSVPLNEITALMSGSQTQSPFSMPGYQAAPTYQATSDASGYQTDLYNQKMGMYGNTMSGLFGLAGAGMQAGGMAAGGGKR